MKQIALAVTLLIFAAVATTAQFTDWSPPVNLGPVVNTPYLDQCMTISKNGLSLFFFSTRYAQKDTVPWHLYVAQRPSTDAPWSEPREIVGFNDGYHASCPQLSLDEHRLFFASNRPGTCGASGMADIWVSRRHDRRDDFGWGPAVNLGCEPNGPNSASWENLPTTFEDETGTEVLYIGSGRPGGPGTGDIWETRMRDDDTFGPAVLVKELSAPYGEGAAVRRDGLEVILTSNRPGGPGNSDLWTSKRASTEDPWPEPILIPVLNTKYVEGAHMTFSFDGRAFYFASNRPGGSGSTDIYVTTREKLRDKKD